MWAFVSGAYLSPPGPVVSPRWTPVFGCCSSMFSHQLFCTLTTQGAAVIRPWRQELPREPAVGASWKLKAGPCQEACLPLVREERDRPWLAESRLSVRATNSWCSALYTKKCISYTSVYEMSSPPCCPHNKKHVISKTRERKELHSQNDYCPCKNLPSHL